MKGRLVREETIGGDTGEEIDQKIGKRAMAGVFNDTNVFEESVDGFYERAFPQEQFVGQAHKHILHAPAQAAKTLCW
jgi:hypothetical protein